MGMTAHLELLEIHLRQVLAPVLTTETHLVAPPSPHHEAQMPADAYPSEGLPDAFFPQAPYAPPQGVYASPQAPYAPPQGVYASPQAPYAPPQGVYASPQAPYAPPQGVYPSPQAQFAPPQWAYAPPRPAPVPPNTVPYYSAVDPAAHRVAYPSAPVAEHTAHDAPEMEDLQGELVNHSEPLAKRAATPARAGKKKKSVSKANGAKAP